MKHIKVISAGPNTAVTSSEVISIVSSVFGLVTGLLATAVGVSLDLQVKGFLSGIDPGHIDSKLTE